MLGRDILSLLDTVDHVECVVDQSEGVRRGWRNRRKRKASGFKPRHGWVRVHKERVRQIYQYRVWVDVGRVVVRRIKGKHILRLYDSANVVHRQES